MAKKDEGRRRVQAQLLRIHPEAQRRLVQATLKKIVNALDLNAIGTVHAVEYAIDGVLALWVIDGQHRLAALLHHGLGEWEVDVIVHADIKTHSAACDLFLKLNTRTAINPFDEFRNQLAAGRPVAVGVARVAQKHGLKISAAAGDGNVVCVKSMMNLYAKDDGHALDATLGVLTNAWGRTASAVEGKLVEGVGFVFARYNGSVDRPALAKKLGKYPGGAPGLHGSAKSLTAVRSSTLGRCVAETVVDVYNKGRSAGRLDPL